MTTQHCIISFVQIASGKSFPSNFPSAPHGAAAQGTVLVCVSATSAATAGDMWEAEVMSQQVSAMLLPFKKGWEIAFFKSNKHLRWLASSNCCDSTFACFCTNSQVKNVNLRPEIPRPSPACMQQPADLVGARLGLRKDIASLTLGKKLKDFDFSIHVGAQWWKSSSRIFQKLEECQINLNCLNISPFSSQVKCEPYISC